MKITKLEQSGLIFETDRGYRFAIDVAVATPLENLVGQKVDSVLISHFHQDHFSPNHIKALKPAKVFLNRECIDLLGETQLESEVKEVRVGETVEFDGVKVTYFHVDHGPNATRKPKENFGMLIEAEGKKYYFAGDMFFPSGIDVTKLEIDKAFIPVGEFYTFGPEEALNFASTFKKIGVVVPIHYHKKPENREKFVKLAVSRGLNTESFPI